jgi:hypothetical protein
MPLLRHHPLLLWLVALLFGAGHGHQVLGQFETHHHHGWEVHSSGEAHPHDDGEHHGDEGDPDQDSHHMNTHHVVVAVIPAPAVVMIVAPLPVVLAELSAEAMPEAPVVGIDHPPQLVG